MKTLQHFFLIAAIWLNSFYLLAQDGIPDISFGADGIVITSLSTENDFAYAVAIQNDGKIIAAGALSVEGLYDLVVIRYNPDGSIDESFGTDGMVITGVEDYLDVALSIVIADDGKIFISGYSYTDIFLLKFNVDGSPDTDFGDAGSVIVSVTPWDDRPHKIVLQPDGKIVVGGFSGEYFMITRFTSTGELDDSYDDDGCTTNYIGGTINFGFTIAVQDDGKILVAGYYYTGTDMNFGIIRYLDNGDIDLPFGDDGIVKIDFFGKNDQAYAMALQPDGKIVVGGFAENNGADFGIIRLNTNGTLDNSFSGDGKVNTDFILNHEEGKALFIEEDGKILLAGFSGQGEHNDFAVLRYNLDGSIDTSFADAGIATLSIGSDAKAFALAVQADHKIVLAGYSESGDGQDFTLVRFGRSQVNIDDPTQTLHLIQITPNPFNDFIQFKTDDNGELIFTDANGREIYHETIMQGRMNIDLSELPNGPYIAKFITRNGIENIVLIKN